MTGFNPIKAFTTDLSAEEKGRKFSKELGAGPDVYVIVARAGNRAFNRMLQALWKQNEQTLQAANKDTATEAEKDEGDTLSFQLVGIAMAKTILLGWGGFTNDDGTPMEYSTEKAEELLALKDFREVISKISGTMNNYLVAQEADNAKNSPPTLSGSSIGVASSNG